jgi:hypothetical protein
MGSQQSRRRCLVMVKPAVCAERRKATALIAICIKLSPGTQAMDF